MRQLRESLDNVCCNYAVQVAYMTSRYVPVSSQYQKRARQLSSLGLFQPIQRSIGSHGDEGFLSLSQSQRQLLRQSDATDFASGGGIQYQDGAVSTGQPELITLENGGADGIEAGQIKRPLFGERFSVGETMQFPVPRLNEDVVSEWPRVFDRGG